MNIYDIAEKCGVSIATVSRVINGSGKVSPATRDKIISIIEENDYTPNAFARGLGTGSMNTVGILCANTSDMYLSEAVYHLENNLRKNGFNSLLCCTGYDRAEKENALRLMLSKNVDAVILVGSNYIEPEDSANDYIRRAAQQVPVFMMNGAIKGDNIYCVTCDDYTVSCELADYLLSGTYIKAMKVDGANRKWVGTNDNGIYLISADGLETIHHFTTDNSPLPSDCIESIAINGKSGEVFIGTDKGMASYMSDATRAEEKLDENNVYAYPNPVKADYSGNISVVGLTHGCVVKIVDAAGFLVNEGESNGGMYSWNGRNARGEKVASGVYHVLTYDSNGNEGVATKILITR